MMDLFENLENNKTGSNFVLKNRQLTFSHRSPFDFISLNNCISNDYFKKESPFWGRCVGSFENLFSENSKICLDWLGCRDSIILYYVNLINN